MRIEIVSRHYCKLLKVRNKIIKTFKELRKRKVLISIFTFRNVNGLFATRSYILLGTHFFDEKPTK